MNLAPKAILAAAILSASGAAMAEKFRIADIDYELDGTKQYAVERAVEVNTKRVFSSYEEFHAYMDNLQQEFTNQRVFDTAELTYRYEYEDGTTGDTPKGDDDGESITIVHAHLRATDSKHMLLVPYPKYNSNSGLNLKLKLKDMNFLGTMSVLSSDINFSIEYDEQDSSDKDYVIGANFSYDYPFKAGPFDSSWNNSFGIDMTLGETIPEFSYETGFTFELPFDTYSIKLDLTEGIYRDMDYEEYGDELYFKTDATFSLPLKIAEIENWGSVKWTPSVEFKVNYDKDGISPENSDISSPLLTFGHSIGTERIDWLGNFRNGLSVSFGQTVGYNFQKDTYPVKVYSKLKAYKAFKYAGISAQAYAFAAMDGSEKIGSMLRGIKDDQYYADYDKKALDVPAAIVFSLDIPVHIVTTDWTGWIGWVFGEESWISRHTGWMRYFDFELQLSPFGDMALAKNDVTGKAFAIKDGWYAGGLEMLVYPAKWRSLVVRGSVGIDAGRKIVDKVVDKLFDSSWRKNCSAVEIYIGIGLQY